LPIPLRPRFHEALETNTIAVQPMTNKVDPSGFNSITPNRLQVTAATYPFRIETTDDVAS
jgi:hypothetical protein